MFTKGPLQRIMFLTLLLLVLLITLQGCGLFGGDGGSEASLAAQNQMQQGDIPEIARRVDGVGQRPRI